MARNVIFAIVYEHLTNAGYIKEPIPNITTDRIKMAYSGTYVQYNLENLRIGSLHANPISAYCGGINLGDMSTNISYQKKGVGIAMFITEMIHFMGNNMGIIYTTNNQTQTMFCDKIRKLLNKPPLIDVIVYETVNPNTRNNIQCTTFDFKNLTFKYKKEELSTQEILDALIPIPKEESKTTNQNATTNQSSNVGKNKSDESITVRPSEMWKNDRTLRAS